jgi:isoleucyl-tRNA synthetase
MSQPEQAPELPPPLPPPLLAAPADHPEQASRPAQAPYPRHAPNAIVPASPDLSQIERDVLSYWADDKTFEASVDARDPGPDGAGEFVCYDGPPFASGLPHYGSLLTGYVKDVIPRYQTMRGRRVERRFGWDCHGLPAEVEAEKRLGITSRAQLTELGVEKFCAACRSSVLRYTREWERYVTRQARWTDFAGGYRTLDLDYMESVLWAFKTLHDKGLVYEGFRVLAYCWRCETPLSNTETRMDDVYADRADLALTVGLRLDSGERLAIWTTTPWTLPSNLAVAVGPELDYTVLASRADDADRLIIGTARLDAYAAELAGYRPAGTVKGSDLAGRRYTPLFGYLRDTPGAFRVLAADFVTTEDGTGAVHLAPAFGEPDQAACLAAGIPTVVTVDPAGRFTSLVPPHAGRHVFDANEPIAAELTSRGAVIRRETYTHPYPHCWRCETPLIYKAVSSWFVAVTQITERMLELNQQIDWTPAHVKDGSFGTWLANARDWSISRNRFWGAPIPVWKSDDPAYPRTDIYGSIEALAADFGVRVTDLHRPGIDQLVRPNPDDPTGASMMRRVPEVLDCWFESGSMPFAQVHYPFENAEWFDSHYPGDFIVEYAAQTRGWFYTLHVLATALFDRPAFRSCLVHGILLGGDGRRMSKRLRNYPDVYQMFDRYGSDAVRWMLMSSPLLRGRDGPVSEAAIADAARQVLLPLWNVYYFFALYANAEGYQAAGRADSAHLLDRYILAKAGQLTADVGARLDRYDICGACASVRGFLDALTNWYVRRSRDRFWAGDKEAFETLRLVLVSLATLIAPLAPMVAEENWRGLTGGRSVHLEDWPDAAAFLADDQLVAAMDAARQVCSAALSVRKARGLRVRLPLAALTVAAPAASSLRPFAEIIADEVNVKRVVLTDNVGGYCKHELLLVPRVLGPRLGGQVQQVIAAVRSGDWSVAEATTGREVVTAGGVELREGEYELKLVAADAGRSAALPRCDGVVVLDLAVTAGLAAEGLARDLIRAVQQARRDAGLAITDRISLVIEAPAEVAAAVRAHGDLIAGETLATVVSLGPAGAGALSAEAGDGQPVRIAVAKA